MSSMKQGIFWSILPGNEQFHTWLNCFIFLKVGAPEVCVLEVLLVMNDLGTHMKTHRKQMPILNCFCWSNTFLAMWQLINEKQRASIITYFIKSTINTFQNNLYTIYKARTHSIEKIMWNEHIVTHFKQHFLVCQHPLQWRHNERDCVSNHQPRDCLPNGLFKRRSKKTSKFCIAGLCEGNSPVTGEFPAQRASNAENVSIWWRHHDHWTHSATPRSLLPTWYSMDLSIDKQLHPLWIVRWYNMSINKLQWCSRWSLRMDK